MGKNRKIKKQKSEKRSQILKSCDCKKKISTTELKYLKKNFKFNSLFSLPTMKKKMIMYHRFSLRKSFKKSRSQLKFFLFLSLPVQFLTTEKKIPSYWNK